MGMIVQEFNHLYDMSIVTTEELDEIVNQIKSLIFDYYNDGLYIRAEEFEDICYLNIILLFGEEYEFLLPYLNDLHIDSSINGEKADELMEPTEAFLSIDYADQSDIKKLQEILKGNGIATEVYYTETNAFERGAGDYHENFLLAILTGAGEKIGEEIISIISEKFRPFQRVGVNSINKEELIAYISQQTDINKRDLHMKNVKKIENEEMVEVLIVNRYKEIKVTCTMDLKTINYEIKNKTETMI